MLRYRVTKDPAAGRADSLQNQPPHAARMSPSCAAECSESSLNLFLAGHFPTRHLAQRLIDSRQLLRLRVVDASAPRFNFPREFRKLLPSPRPLRLVSTLCFICARRSKMISLFSGLIPHPVSDTETRRKPPSSARGVLSTVTVPSSGVNLIPLSIRLMRICSTRAGSAQIKGRPAGILGMQADVLHRRIRAARAESLGNERSPGLRAGAPA